MVDIFGRDANSPEAKSYQDTLHEIGELKRRIAELYRSIGKDAEADTIFPPDRTAEVDSAPIANRKGLEC